VLVGFRVREGLVVLVVLVVLVRGKERLVLLVLG
jgi:hypothetical protein